MTVDDKIRNEKLQYYIHRKAAKISALSSGKVDKYEYLTGEETLPSNQRQNKKLQENKQKRLKIKTNENNRKKFFRNFKTKINF